MSALAERVQMSLQTPQARVRASIAMTFAHEVAERLLQAVKANPAFHLSDLRSDDERGIFIEKATEFLLDEAVREDLTTRLNQTRAHAEALAEDEQGTVMRRARQDVITFGDPMVAAFMRTSVAFCPICRERLISNRVDVLVTDNIKGMAHGLCCAKDEARFQFISEYVYRLVPRG